MGRGKTWMPGEVPSIIIDGRDTPQTRSHRRLLVITSLLCSSAYLLFSSHATSYLTTTRQGIASAFDPVCSQVDAITPVKHSSLLEKLDDLYHTKDFQLNAYESLGGVVRIPTESEDEEKSPTEDPVFWEKFKPLHDYLEERFPLMHSRLNVTKANQYSLIYEWQGTNSNLKPILLTAHQDVVPVEPETITDWHQPPFSGYYDGEWIWGRGSCDDKSNMVASMIAVETLLESGFEPSRGIVLAFGTDEERGGYHGARPIGDYLLEKFGEDSFSIIVDEGGRLDDTYGATFAMPAVAEKGYLDVRIEVSTPGGHSSIPPAHTGIGVLAAVVQALEAQPHVPELRRDRTYYQHLQCIAEHGSDVPDELRSLVKKSRKSNKALDNLIEFLDSRDREFRPSTATTQAVDIISGGVKSNALPELSFAVVNHRIADYSSVDDLQDRFTSVVLPISKGHNLSVIAFGKEVYSPGVYNTLGQLRLSDAFNSGLQPAPVTPTFGNNPWDFLSGTIKATLHTSRRRKEDGAVIVSPGLSLGNTDTRWYWKLTNHIFRYGHKARSDAFNGAHTVNEAIRAEGFLEVIRFFTVLILNADETKLLE